jgi:hypothetical protein
MNDWRAFMTKYYPEGDQADPQDIGAASRPRRLHLPGVGALTIRIAGLAKRF